MKKNLKLILIVILIVTLTILGITAIFLCNKNKNIVQQSASMSETINQSEVINAEELLKNVTDAESMKHNTEYLQSLIDQVSNAGGGTVHIPAGTYYFMPNYDREDGAKYTWIGDNKDRAYYIIMCKDNVTVEGTLDANGNKATILKPFGNDMELSINMFHYISDDFVYLDNADFNNFIIDSSDTWKKSSADYLAHGKGFMIAPYKNCDWNNVEVRNTDGTGFGMDFPINSTIKNCLAVGCGKAATENDIGASGFGIGTGYSEEESILIENCTAIGNRKYGFFFEHQGLLRNDCTATKAKGFNLENCTASGNMYNFGGEKGYDVTFSNCTSNVTGEENPLGNKNSLGFYFEANSKRINTKGCKVNYVFTDVTDSSKEYYKPVYWALNNALIDGGSIKTEFLPNEECVKAQAIVLLWRKDGRRGDVVLSNDNIETGYTDVGNNEFYTDAVIWGRDEGIIDYNKGETNEFNPNGACMRAEFIAMLWKYAGRPEVEITYSLNEMWYEKAINWATQKGIIGEELATTEECEKSATRGEIVTWLYRGASDIAETPEKNTTITFEDENLYNGIVQALGEKIENKDDEQKTIIMKDEEVANVESLNLEGMGIKNLSGIEKFVNLKNLKLYNNKIEDITPILMNTKLEVLNIAYNRIKSLEGIENLTNLVELQAQGNQIDEIPELSNIQTDKLKIAQGYIRTSINTNQGKNEIDLPQAFIQAQQDLNRYYARGAFELENCEWNEDRTKIVVDANTIAMTNAKITITSGILQGTELFVYGVGIAYYIDNTQMELENTDLDINQDGEITLADAELMKKYVDKDMADLTQEQIGRILKVDVNYDDEINNVDYNRFVKYINKETDILFTIMTDTSSPVNFDIIAQIYTLNPNIITNDEMYIFTENGEHEMSFVDETGTQNILIASVNCIDKQAPNYEISYSPTDFTKDNVTVTITSTDDEPIYIDEEYEDEYGEIQTTGWTASEDRKILTKIYTENTTEMVLLADEAGNFTIVEVVVNNIFANAPSSGSLILKEQNSLGEIYTSNTWTNQNVYIAIDESNRPANTTMSYEINGQGPYTASQTITQEGIYEIVLTTTDDIGNSTKVNYQVKIDKTKPEIGTLHLREESSIGNELENEVITNKNVYVSLEKGTDNLSGIAQSYYVLNGDETNQITDSEIYRADGEYPLKVISIDRAGNQSEKTYRFIISKQAPILRQEQELQADGTLKVKIISDKQLDDSLKVEGWNLSPNKLELTKIYYIDKTETVTVKDLLGNTATITIEVTGITAIDFLVDVTYSTKELTNQDVTVTITSVTPMKAISGWTLQNQYKQTKKFSSNTTQNITIESTTGKTIQETISITNIDKMAPSVSVDYSTQKMTNNDVTVTVVADEEIEPVNGWILSGENTLQKTFSQNSTEIITIKDLAGNTTTQTIQVNNIDKVAPIVEVTYSLEEETYEPVVVTITTNEAVKGINGWESVNTNTLQKTFSQNSTEIVNIEDLVGNTKSVTIRISNIKQKQEIKDDIYEITQDKYILGIKPTTKWEDCLRNLGEITLSETKTGIVKTGDQITVNNITYTLIVVGDITKDGNFDLQDLSNLLFHISNIKELNGEKLKAADMNLDKEVDTIDLSNMCIKLTNLE